MYLAAPSPVAFPYGWSESPYGMGDAQSATQLVSAGGALLGAGAAVAAPALLSAGLISAAAVPFIGPAIAGVTLAIGLLVKNSGCGQTCVITSQWANQAEPLLAQNIREYFKVPAPRAQSLQKTALDNFDRIWDTLVKQCSQPGTGNAGVRCISDRQANACTWHQTSDSPLLQYPGEPQPGECWNWWSGYRDPIANDPDVVPDGALLAASASDVTSTVASDLSGGGSNLLLFGAAALVLAGVFFK